MRLGFVAALVSLAASGTAIACVQPKAQPTPANRYALARMQKQFKALKALRQQDEPATGAAPTMVGMWLTSFIADGEVVDAGFDVWHADGTQVLNDTPPPAAGAVCLGIWKQTGEVTYELKHPSWAFDETGTTLIGIAYILEKVTLDPLGNSYKGTYSIEGFDLEGDHVYHVEGQLSGERITMAPPTGQVP